MINRSKTNIKIKICRAFLFAFNLLPSLGYAQLPSAETTIDKKDILIGEQFKVKVKTNYKPGEFNFRGFGFPDSIPHFDIVDKGRADTIVYKDNSSAIEQTLTFTSFDSGRWTLPSLPVNLDPIKPGKSYDLFTDSFRINVSYALPDTSNQLRDIKPLIETEVNDYTWYYLAAGVLLLVLIVVLTIRYYKKRKQGPVPVFTSKLTPYDEAILELDNLKQADLGNPVEIKLYHTKLGDIFKRYLGRRENINFQNHTTGDLLIGSFKNNFRAENISTLAMVLRCSDAVKFAKYLPGIAESEDCLMKIKETIILLETQIPPVQALLPGATHKT